MRNNAAHQSSRRHFWNALVNGMTIRQAAERASLDTHAANFRTQLYDLVHGARGLNVVLQRVWRIGHPDVWEPGPRAEVPLF